MDRLDRDVIRIIYMKVHKYLVYNFLLRHTHLKRTAQVFFFFFFFFCRRFSFYVVAQLEPLLQGGFELPAELKQSLINLLHDLMALN